MRHKKYIIILCILCMCMLVAPAMANIKACSQCTPDTKSQVGILCPEACIRAFGEDFLGVSNEKSHFHWMEPDQKDPHQVITEILYESLGESFATELDHFEENFHQIIEENFVLVIDFYAILYENLGENSEVILLQHIPEEILQEILIGEYEDIVHELLKQIPEEGLHEIIDQIFGQIPEERLDGIVHQIIEGIPETILQQLPEEKREEISEEIHRYLSDEILEMIIEKDVEIRTAEPTTIPTTELAQTPATEPTTIPTAEPTTEPATIPTAEPTTEPATEPTAIPTTEPTTEPTAIPTVIPTAEPTKEPTTELWYPSGTNVDTKEPSTSRHVIGEIIDLGDGYSLIIGNRVTGEAGRPITNNGVYLDVWLEKDGEYVTGTHKQLRESGGKTVAVINNAIRVTLIAGCGSSGSVCAGGKNDNNIDTPFESKVEIIDNIGLASGGISKKIELGGDTTLPKTGCSQHIVPKSSK